MSNNDQLDRLANKINTEEDITPPGELFRQERLDNIPVSQWPAYLDETALDVIDGRLRNNGSGITTENFGDELGEYYKQGLLALSGSDPELRSALDKVSDSELGDTVLDLTRLVRNARKRYDDVAGALEKFVNKVVASHTNDFDPVSLPRGSVTASEILIALLVDPVVSGNSKYVLEKIDGSRDINKVLENPLMMTPLEPEYRDTLNNWVGNNYSGHVEIPDERPRADLVLGTSTVAHHYGDLHPMDSDIKSSVRGSTTPTILVVDESEERLREWANAFDDFLGLPRDKLDVSGFRPVRFDWGRVFFRTSEQMKDTKSLKYDLILLGGVETYSEMEWVDALDKSENDYMAFSRETLRGFDEIEFDGSNSDFSWHIRYAELEDEDMIGLAKECRRGIKEFIQTPLETSGRRRTVNFDTCEEALSFSGTKGGLGLKRENDGFRRFSTALLARRTKSMAAYPSVNDAARLVADLIDSKRVLVLAGERVKEGFTNHLESLLGEKTAEKKVYSYQPRNASSQSFDEPESGAFVTTPIALFEDTQKPEVDVVVNLSRGFTERGEKQFVRRVKREIPSENEAEYCHLVGVPSPHISTVDGVSLIKSASDYLELGDEVGGGPGYAVSSPRLGSRIEKLERTGSERIEDDDVVSQRTSSLAKEIRDNGGALLSNYRISGSDSSMKPLTPSKDELEVETVGFSVDDDFDIDEVDVDELIDLLESDDEMTIVNACHALSKIAEENPEDVEPAEERLVELLDTENQDVLDYVCRALGFIGSQEALDKLKGLQNDTEDNNDIVERAVLRIEKRHGGDQMSKEKAEDSNRDLAKQLRNKARRKPEEVESDHDKLRETLESEDPKTREYAAEAVREIAKQEPDQATDFNEDFVRLLDDPYKDVRVYAAQTLGFVKPLEALEPLRELTSDDNAGVRAAAKQAIRKIEKEKERIEDEDKDEDEDEKTEATENKEEEEDGAESEEDSEAEETEEQQDKGDDEGTESEDIETEEDDAAQPQTTSAQRNSAKSDGSGKSDDSDSKKESKKKGTSSSSTDSGSKGGAKKDSKDKDEDKEKGDGKMILNTAKDGIDNTEADFSELILIWLLENGDEEKEYTVDAFSTIVDEYPDAVKSQTGRFVSMLDDEHEDVRRYSSLIVLEISQQYPEELEEHIPTILESLKDKDGTVHDNMRESLTNLAKKYPEKVVGGVADKAV